MPQANVKHRVNIIESERGFGRKVDEVKLFDTEAEAREFIRKYNADNTSTGGVPDWYMQAEYAGRAGHRVNIIESERGWGSKIAEVKYFATRDEAREFVRKFNADNTTTGGVPDWYTQAEYVGE